MKAAAWKYGHQKLIFIDFTFGFCSAHTLLLIIMVLDENHKGVPIAKIIFTATPDAKVTHTDYNGALVKCLIEKWRVGLVE